MKKTLTRDSTQSSSGQDDTVTEESEFDTLVGEVFKSKMDVAGSEGEKEPVPMNLVRKERDLTIDEKRFLLAVEHGDMPKVKQFLQDAAATGHININCVDPLGRSALLIAIENENLELLEVLLHHNVELGDALLHAISEVNVEAVEMLLNYEEDKRKEQEEKEKDGEAFPPPPPYEQVRESAFTSDITPIILAAHRDNYEIIKILLDRGASIPMPHDVRCGCDECVQNNMSDSLRHSRSRLNAYRALSSPSLIALSSKDPILTAFELSWELKYLSGIENEFKMEYEHLAKQCQEFAAVLLDQTRTSQELEVILNHDTGSNMFDQGTSVQQPPPNDRMCLSRLRLAIKYKQKKFVSHPNCQQLLASIWYEGLPGFRRRNIVYKLSMIGVVGLMFPIFSIIYMIAPKSSVGRMLRKPFIKFICHSASYFTFLFFLILASQRIESIISIGEENIPDQEPDNSSSTPTYKNERRGAPATSIEWMIMAWVFGLIWMEIKQLWDDGLWEYVHDMWNILDFITNALYLATIALRTCAYFMVEQEKLEGKWEMAMAPRKDWDAYDPTLISEGLFAAANIFSSLKLVHIFTVNPYLGPLQISLGRMVFDIMKFAFILALVVFAFACGLTQLYWYYATMRADECLRGGPEDSSCDKKYKSFLNLFETLQTLYWGLYNLIDLDRFDLKENHTYTEFVGLLMFGCYSAISIVVLLNMLIAMMSNSFQYIATLQTLYWGLFSLVDRSHFDLLENHEYTEFVGLLMFGIYCAMSIVVLLNMLIAMMSNSYQFIANQADYEWKFARSKLWMSYFEEGGTVPPPFNIIPSPKSVYYLLKWFYQKICSCSTKQKRTRWKSLRKFVRKVSERDARYQAVIRSLVKRYITNMQRQQQHQGVNEDDINEIKQDISSFRYELLEILKYSGISGPPGERKSTMNKKNRLQERRLMKGLNLERNIETIPEQDFDLPDFLKTDYKKGRPRHSQSVKRFTHLSRFRIGSRKGKASAAQQWDDLISTVRAQRQKECIKKTQSASLDRQSTLETDTSFSSDPNLVRDTDNTVQVASASALATAVGLHAEPGLKLRRTVSQPPLNNSGSSPFNIQPSSSDTTDVLQSEGPKRVTFEWKNSVEPQTVQYVEPDHKYTSVPSTSVGLKKRSYGATVTNGDQEPSDSPS